jgi:hypothetical protein
LSKPQQDRLVDVRTADVGDLLPRYGGDFLDLGDGVDQPLNPERRGPVRRCVDATLGCAGDSPPGCEDNDPRLDLLLRRHGAARQESCGDK